MKPFLLLTLVSLTAFAGPRKPLPGQAGNDNIELTGTVIVDRDEIRQALGQDLGPGYVVVKIQVVPKMDHPLAVSPDDFTMVSHKDGQRSGALAPGEIAGSGALVVKQAPEKSWSPGTTINGPMWAGVTPRNSAPPPETADKKGKEPAPDPKDRNALLAALKSKVLPDKSIKDPAEGLLYFAIDGKIKPKDLSVIYKGQAGRLIMDFEEGK